MNNLENATKIDMKTKRYLIFILLLAAALVAFAGNLGQTLSLLKDELRAQYQQKIDNRAKTTANFEEHHQKLLDLMEDCEELSLMLYSRQPDYTFDLCFAFEKVTEEYENFNKDKESVDQTLSDLDFEIRRYANLAEVLRRIPPEREAVIELPDSLTCDSDTLQNLYSLTETPLNEIIEASLLDSTRLMRSLDYQGEADRDSCLYYVAELMKIYADHRSLIVADTALYHETYLRMQYAYDYVQEYYQIIQRKILKDGQTSWVTILDAPETYWEKAIDSIRTKNNSVVLFYIVGFFALWGLVALLLLSVFRRVKVVQRWVAKEQRPYVVLLLTCVLCIAIADIYSLSDPKEARAIYLSNTYLWLLVALIVALLSRLKSEQLKYGLGNYLPTIYTAAVVVSCRVLFMPNDMMNFFLPPLLIVASVWQLLICLLRRNKMESVDAVISWISFSIIVVATVIAWVGYIFVALLVLLWWYLQLAFILTLIVVSHLLSFYKEKRLNSRIKAYSESVTYVDGSDKEKLMFGVTWFYDLIKEVIIPLMGITSLIYSLRLSLDVFDFDKLFKALCYEPFYQLVNASGEMVLSVSIYSLALLMGLVFVFLYISKALRYLWQYGSYVRFMRKNKCSTIEKNAINLSLANTVINVLVWAVYAILAIDMLQIPTSTVGLILGGFSAGLGIALKDILNNIIYGIQLMTGRLKIGDWIECDGVRGTVSDITYQTTLLETSDGSTVSFLNSDLFQKSFTNLSKSISYMLVKIDVGVAYGTDMQHVRDILLEAMQEMCTQDSSGRDVVDPSKGISVVFGDFGDSAVEVSVKQYVLSNQCISYTERAKEVIYNALNANGIAIPFPQRDIRVIH